MADYENQIRSLRNKLDQSLLNVATIRREVNSESGTVSVMTPRYPTNLIRVFAFGVCTAVSGLIVAIIGVAVVNLKIQVGGSTMLAIGCVLITLAVMQGEGLNRPSS